MNIDRVAKLMTAGAARPGFTARVMAPIEGRPSPGFTARVMTGLDARRSRPAFGRALILVPAALGVIASAAYLLLPGAAHAPSLPGAPVLATKAGLRVPGIPPQEQPSPVRSVRASRPREVVAPPELPALAPIYTIAALEGPANIAVKNIEPAARTIPALEAPAPLKIPDLPANGGGSQKEIKE